MATTANKGKDKNKKTLAEIFAHARVGIAIEKDNFAYLSCTGANHDKLFDLLKKSFTREVSKYNNFFHRYENTRVKHFSIVEKGAKLKIKAGLVPFLCNSLYVNKINYNITNKRCGVHVTDPDDFAFQLNMFVELRPYQKEAVEAVFNSSAGNFCCVQLPTGSGKTETAASIIKTYMSIAKSSNNTVVYVVPTVKLQKEATARFTSYGIQCNVGGVDFQPDCVNITTYMALVRSTIAKETAAKVGCIIWDEAHHLKAEKSSKAVHQFKNLQMSVGLSATITPDIEYKRTLKRINNDDFNIFGVTGMPVYYKTIVETIQEEFVTPVEIRVVENDECVYVKSKEEIPTWHEIKKQVLMSPNRTALICDTVRHIVETQGFNTICLLIPEVEWSRLVMRDIYNEFCNDENTAIILTYGNNTYDVYVDGKLVRANDAEDKAELDRLIKDPDVRTIFSCTSYAYEGIDITNMQAIINVYGGKSTTRVKQQAGRVMRLFGDKNKAYIYEFADKNCQVAMNQFNARRKIYKNDYHAKIVVEKFNK